MGGAIMNASDIRLVNKMKEVRARLTEIENACEQRISMAIDENELWFLDQHVDGIIEMATEFVINMDDGE